MSSDELRFVMEKIVRLELKHLFVSWHGKFLMKACFWDF